MPLLKRLIVSGLIILLPAVAHAVDIIAQTGSVYQGTETGFKPVAIRTYVAPGSRIMIAQDSVALVQYPACSAFVHGPQIVEVPVLPPCPIGTNSTVFHPKPEPVTAAPVKGQSGSEASFFGAGGTNTLIVGGLVVGGVGAAAVALAAGAKDDKPSSP